MGAYLIDHPPRIRQFRARGTTISGVIVLHTAESAPDAFGADGGAEAVARFIQQRTTYGSYHWLADSDSLIDLVPMRDMQAYGEGTGTNPHAIHISAATQAHRWPGLPGDWVEGTIENMALAAHKASDLLEDVHGLRIPAKRISAAQARARGEGFVTHAALDPSRRSDPGDGFPWDKFMEAFKDLESPKAPRPSRGTQVDRALRRTSAAITALEKAHGNERREAKIEKAEAELREARKALRAIGIINAQK